VGIYPTTCIVVIWPRRRNQPIHRKISIHTKLAEPVPESRRHTRVVRSPPRPGERAQIKIVDETAASRDLMPLVLGLEVREPA